MHLSATAVRHRAEGARRKRHYLAKYVVALFFPLLVSFLVASPSLTTLGISRTSNFSAVRICSARRPSFLDLSRPWTLGELRAAGFREKLYYKEDGSTFTGAGRTPSLYLAPEGSDELVHLREPIEAPKEQRDEYREAVRAFVESAKPRPAQRPRGPHR
jgi:hypothetical protein